jgi:hypothetical protein
MDRTGVAVAVAVVAALAAVLAAQTRRTRALREELATCREDAAVLEERWRACRAELREAQRLE